MSIDQKQEAYTSLPSSTEGRMEKMKLVHLSRHTSWETEEFLLDDWHPRARFPKNNLHYLYAWENERGMWLPSLSVFFVKDTLIKECKTNMLTSRNPVKVWSNFSNWNQQIQVQKSWLHYSYQSPGSSNVMQFYQIVLMSQDNYIHREKKHLRAFVPNRYNYRAF